MDVTADSLQLRNLMVNIMMKAITSILGGVLLAIGVIGFFSHNFMEMMLNPLHDSLLILCGLFALYYGVQGTEFQARYCCRAFGWMFGIFGVLTFFAGPGTAEVGSTVIAAQHVLKVMVGHLELATADGIRDILIGAVALIAGYFPRQTEIEIDMAAQDAVIKMEKEAKKIESEASRSGS